MRDSSTYQAILEEGRQEGRTEGRVEEAREVLIEMGTLRFGPPDTRALAVLAAITSHDQLHALVRRHLGVSSWDELLAGVE